MRASTARLLLVLLLFATSSAHAQISGIDTAAAMDTTVAAEPAGWGFAPRMRGAHAVAMTDVMTFTLGASIDVDILRNSGLRPPLALGVRAGFESVADGMILHASMYDDYVATLLTRFSIGGRSAELTVYGGYTWIWQYIGDMYTGFEKRVSVLPVIGVEARWMFIPKYAGLVVRMSTASNRLFRSSPMFDRTRREFNSGGLGFILGWEP